MADFTPEIIDSVLAACSAGEAEIAEALSRSLDNTFTLVVDEPVTWSGDELKPELDGPGLAAVLTVGDQAAMAVLPESSGLVPSWCAEPDATGTSKLATLAQELGMLLLPEEFMAEDFKAASVDNLWEAIERGGVGDSPGLVSLTLTAGEASAPLRLIWPVPKVEAILGIVTEQEAEASKKSEAVEKRVPAPASENPKQSEKPKHHSVTCVEELPLYTQSILKVELPVIVTLARKKQPVSTLLALGPGSIIQFDKICDELLDLDVGDHRIGQGEAVKVGEKFGIRISTLLLPDERFVPAKPATT